MIVQQPPGALNAALNLLKTVEAGPPDTLRDAKAVQLRGQIAFDQRRDHDAVRLHLDAAGRLESIDAGLARETFLEGLMAAIFAGELDGPEGALAVAAAARAAVLASPSPGVTDFVLEGFVLRLTEGYSAAAAPVMARA